MTAIALNQKTADISINVLVPRSAPVVEATPSLRAGGDTGNGDSGRKPGNPAKALKGLAVALVSLFFVGGGSYLAYNAIGHMKTFQDTDDAYITGHLHNISSRISGTVEKVLVEDNQHVDKGQVLAVLERQDFQVKVERALSAMKLAERQAHVAKESIVMASTTAEGHDISAQGGVSHAEAAISSSQAGVKQAMAQLDVSRTDVAAKEAELTRAEADFRRFDSLAKQGAVSEQQADLARRDFVVAGKAKEAAEERVHAVEASYQQAIQLVQSAHAALTQSKGQVQLARASAVQTNINQNQYEVATAAIDEARVALKEAVLNLSYTVITAPTTGRIGKKAVEVGQRIEPGQPILTIVSDELWVVANFKETQLSQMQKGRPVEIKIDSFPDQKFSGKVESVAPGSGSSFSVLPSDNATGNFTKIVQRVPVKIVFDRKSLGAYANRLVPGMSVVVGVNVAGK